MSDASRVVVSKVASQIWFWIEARELAELAVGQVDDLIRYDRYAPVASLRILIRPDATSKD